MMDGPISVREVLMLLLNADKYPRYNAHDWQEADLWEEEALAKAKTAHSSSDDPPEFTHWLAALQQPGRTSETREAVFQAMHDYFEPEGAET